MHSIRILIPTHVTPDTKSITTLFFENLLPILKQHVNVHIIWFVYQPDAINQTLKISDNVTIVDFHDYDNAVELLQKHKPDIVFADATRSFIDYALSTAAKFIGIPTFSMFYSDWYYTQIGNKIQYVTHNISRFFQSSTPTDTNQNKKQLMRRGRFFIKKYFFLARTQKAAKTNMFKIVLNFFMLLQHNLFNMETDSRFTTTVHFLEDEKLQNSLIDAGFEKSTLIVTGNPIFDKALQKSLEQKNPYEKTKKKRILLAPSTLYEHGFWSKEQRDFSIKETLKQIHQKNNEISISVKVHPSTSVLSEYTSIINPIDSSIPVYQKGDIQEYLENIDLVITFQSSTAEVYAIIARKPIIICNFFKSQRDTLVEKGLAIECTNPSDLVKLIEQIHQNSEYEKKRDDFIKEFLYKADGRASERICDELIKLVTSKRIS